MEINPILPWSKVIFKTQVHNIGKEFKQRWNAFRIGKRKTFQKCLYLPLVTYKQLTNQLTPQKKVRPQNRVVPHLREKFPAFYTIRYFIPKFTTALHLYQFWARRTQFTSFFLFVYDQF